MPDGDPEGIRRIDRMNWTGVGIVVPRDRWLSGRSRPEFKRTGVYILVGYGDDDLPILYIGEGEEVQERIDAHFQNKEFWQWCVAFVTSNDELNKAHVRWLEYALIRQAKIANRSHSNNGTNPSEPSLSEAEKADIRAFLNEILRILPLVGLRAFEEPRLVAPPNPASVFPATWAEAGEEAVVVIVPAQEDGFKETFLGENCWYAIRISPQKLEKIKFIAGYQISPTSAVTHYAPVKQIESYGEEGKYKLTFSEPATPIGPIPFGDAPTGSMQGPRYTTLGQLKVAKKLMDLFDKT